MRKIIKIFTAILIFTLTLTSVVYAKVNIPDATSDFYVNDFANVFSSSEKAQLMEKAVALSDEHDGIQVVVTTVKSLDGNVLEDYSYDMYNQYGIGKNDMGLLILLSTGDRKIRVEVGKSMEAYINDSKAGRFIDQYAIPSLREDKFNEGLINLQGALIDEVILCIGNENLDSEKLSDSEKGELLLSVLGFFLIIIVATGLILLIVFIVKKIKNKYKERKEMIANLNTKIEELQLEIAEKEEKIRSTERSLNIKINRLSNKNSLLNKEYHNLESEYTTLKDRYERAIKLYPTVDSEITEMIEDEIRRRDIAIAQEVDSIITRVINLTASKDIISEISDALNQYSNLTQKQKSYIKSDISKLNRLYDESLKLKQEYDLKVIEEKNKKRAEEAAVAITAIISAISIGRASNFSRLKKARSIYDDLDCVASSYFDKSVLNKLDQLYMQAKRDKDEEEARERREREERRRRQSHYNHSSSRGGGSGFSGFGGRSGGGGASRGF